MSDPTEFLKQQARAQAQAQADVLQQAPAPERPPLPTFTDRELRRIAEQIEILTKARRASEGLGVTGLVDVISVEFPIGIRAVLRWTPRATNDTETRLHYLGRARDAYQLDLITPVTEPVIKLREPQKTRDRRNDPQARRIGDQVKRQAAEQVRDIVQVEAPVVHVADSEGLSEAVHDIVQHGPRLGAA